MMDMVSIYHGTVSVWDDSETEYDYKFYLITHKSGY